MIDEVRLIHLDVNLQLVCISYRRVLFLVNSVLLIFEIQDTHFPLHMVRSMHNYMWCGLMKGLFRRAEILRPIILISDYSRWVADLVLRSSDRRK